MTLLKEIKQGEERTFVFDTTEDGTLTLETDEDCTLILRSKAQRFHELTPVPVTASVENVIRSDGTVDYLVLDVTAIHEESFAERHPEQSTATVGADALDSIAQGLGEVRVRRRERVDQSSVVTDASGERDRADATPSSARNREIRREVGNE